MIEIVEQNGLKSLLLPNGGNIFFNIPTGGDWSSIRVGVGLSVYTGSLYSGEYEQLATGESRGIFFGNDYFSAGINSVFAFGLTNTTGSGYLYDNPFIGVTNFRTSNFLSSFSNINSTGRLNPYEGNGDIFNVTGITFDLGFSYETNFCAQDWTKRPSYTQRLTGVTPIVTFTSGYSISPMLHESLSGHFYWNVFSFEKNSSDIIRCGVNNPQFTRGVNFIENTKEKRKYISSMEMASYSSYVGSSSYFQNSGLYFVIVGAPTYAPDIHFRIHDFVCILDYK